MTKAQEIYERVEALVAAGTPKADAFRAVAEEYGQPFNSMRGAYYAHSRRVGGGSPTPRARKPRETTTATAVESAVAALTKALESIDAEIELAKARAEEAKAEYDELKGSAASRKSAIEAKITALAD